MKRTFTYSLFLFCSLSFSICLLVLLLTGFSVTKAHPVYHHYVNKAIITNVAGNIAVSPMKLYDNDVAGGAAGISRQVTVTNTSTTSPLSVTGISLSGADAGQFVPGSLPSFPASIAPEESITFTVAFSAATVGIKTAAINISSDDASQPTVSVLLRGLGTAGLGGTNEPSLQAILDLYEIPVNVGDDDANTNIIHSNSTQQRAALLGDEVSLQQFVKAGSGNVTVEPLSVFGPTANNPIVGMGWYLSGNSSSATELFTVSNSPTSNGQTVNVPATGVLSFDPGNVSFGFYSRWPFFGNRFLYSEDNLNTFSGAIPHHVRVYPYKDQNGTVVPFTYVVAFEEHTAGFDYQDITFIVRNVTSAATLPIRENNPLPIAGRYNKLKVYPNPVHKNFTVEVPGSSEGRIALQMLDATGRVYELGSASIPAGGAKLEVDIAKQQLAPGVYFLRLTTEDHKTEIRKLLVE